MVNWSNLNLKSVSKWYFHQKKKKKISYINIMATGDATSATWLLVANANNYANVYVYLLIYIYAFLSLFIILFLIFYFSNIQIIIFFYENMKKA